MSTRGRRDSSRTRKRDPVLSGRSEGLFSEEEPHNNAGIVDNILPAPQTVEHVTDIFGLAKIPLAILLTVYLVIGIFAGIMRFRASVVPNDRWENGTRVYEDELPREVILAMMCQVPVLSWIWYNCPASHSTELPHCYIPTLRSITPFLCIESRSKADQAEESRRNILELMGEQESLEKVKDTGAQIYAIFEEMRVSQHAFDVLRIVLQHSKLKSRDELLRELNGYHDIWHQMVYDYLRFGHQCNYTVDKLVDLDLHLMREIHPSAVFEHLRQNSLLLSVFERVFYPFLFQDSPVHFLYSDHISQVSQLTREIIKVTDRLLKDLEDGDTRLKLVASTASNEYSEQVDTTVGLQYLLSMVNAHNGDFSEWTRGIEEAMTQRQNANEELQKLKFELRAKLSTLMGLHSRFSHPEAGRNPFAQLPMITHLKFINSTLATLTAKRKPTGAADK